jgi:GNAT superfamily N-acetyltransferase
MSSLYAQYIQEREGKSILESDKGYATYSFTDDGCYIEDIFVIKEHRKSGEAARLADQIVEIARQKGCKKLYGSISPSANGSTASLKVLLSYGFRLSSSANNFILFVMDIGA